jgi:hypothetical protein
MEKIRGRAETPGEKRAIIERLYAAWLIMPDLRLGQLLENAVPGSPALGSALYYCEDFELVDRLEKYCMDSKTKEIVEE